jgi:YVTN family beta-propeller protein
MGIRRAVKGFRAPLLPLVAVLALAAASGARAQTLYVANQASATLSVVNTLTDNLATTVATGAGPLGVAASSDGRIVVIANSGDNTITIVDATSGNVIAAVAVGNQPTGVAITPDDTTAYVANSGDNTVSVVKLSNATVTATISVGLAPFGVVVSPTGQTVYITNSFANTVSVIATANNTVTATIPVGASPSGVAAAPNGNSVYVSNSADNTVSVITNNTVSSTIPVGAGPFGIAVTPNGVVYVANLEDGTISVLSTANSVISVGGAPYGVAVSTDGSTVFAVNKTAEQVSVISTSTNSVAGSIAVPGTPGSFGQFFGPSGPPASVLAAAVLPTSRSVVVGNSATFAATVLNTSATNVNNCQFALPRAFPTGLSLLYQTLSPSGQLTGQPNQPVSIAANSGQGFLLAFQSSSPVNSISQPLVISCSGTSAAPDVVGLDVPGLSFSTTPVPDVVALAATTSNNGIVSTPVGTAAAFAVATVDVGAAGTLTASADTEGIQLPLTLSVCQSNPNTGACLASPAPSVAVTFTAGGTPTFSVFVTPSAPISFAPASSRVFLRFLDSNGVSHGSTSVAVRTQ